MVLVELQIYETRKNRKESKHQSGLDASDPCEAQQKNRGRKPELVVEFTGKLLGKGGYGIVVETTMGAVKMEIDACSRSFCEHALWRVYNYFLVSLES
jgi:hypothetical protein